jgi:hypothetical protein
LTTLQSWYQIDPRGHPLIRYESKKENKNTREITGGTKSLFLFNWALEGSWGGFFGFEVDELLLSSGMVEEFEDEEESLEEVVGFAIVNFEETTESDFLLNAFFDVREFFVSKLPESESEG